ncbi:MAG TPA: response regulator [Stellaceae bacterium]|jgi:two-component system KDP operon response regulator KdpE|nr:response regulator [Stellaceae bacterium]
MTRTTRILVVDDEAAIRRFLRTGLVAHGYDIDEAESGAQAIELARAHPPDLVILDLGLGDMDGTEALQQLRRTSLVPVIVLSVRNDEKEKVRALDLGADDYMTKPFGMEELIARVRTALRHRLQQQGEMPVFHSGELAVDVARRLVTLRGVEIKLSVKEFDLLQCLVKHVGKVLTHQFLLREVWGPAHGEDVQYLRVYIRTLRQKLEEDPTRPRYLLTETGVGYRLQAPE